MDRCKSRLTTQPALRDATRWLAGAVMTRRHQPAIENLYFTRMNISGSKTNGNNKLTNLTNLSCGLVLSRRLSDWLTILAS